MEVLDPAAKCSLDTRPSSVMKLRYTHQTVSKEDLGITFLSIPKMCPTGQLALDQYKSSSKYIGSCMVGTPING